MSAEGAKNKNPQTTFNWLLLALYVKEMLDTRTNGLKSSVLAPS